MTWTDVAKATGGTWSNPVDPQGNQTYDEASMTYDSATDYYDSTNPNQWTNLSKASVIGWTDIVKAV